MENEGAISQQLAALIALLSKNATTGKTAEEKPREVTTAETRVEVDNLGENVKKFLSSLFKFEQPEVKKQTEKKTSFWMDIIVLLGAALFGIWSYFQKYILPILEEIGALFKEDGLIGRFIKGIKNLFSEDSLVGRCIKAIKNLFTEEGIFGKLIKSFRETKLGKFVDSVITKIKGIFNKFGKIFSKEGKIGSLFSKEGKLMKLFEPVLKLFGEAGPFKAVFTKIKFFGAIFEKFAVFLTPIFALFDFKAGWDDEMKSSGSKAKAATKGIIAFAMNILTLGFINFEDIKKSLDKVMDSITKGDWLGAIKDTLIIIPEAIFKIPVKIIGWITGFFNKEAGDKIEAWMKSFSLGELLGKIGDSIGEWVGDYIIDPIMSFYNSLEMFFTQTLPHAFNTFIESITNFFDKIINFDYSSILQKIPGVSKLMNFFGSKEATPSSPSVPSAPLASTAQDYISRPGQPVTQFSSSDTVIGFKEGGPILEQLTANASYGKQFNELSLKYYGDNIDILTDIKIALADLAEQLLTSGKGNVVVSNKTNNIVLPAMGTTTNFRQNYLT